VTTSFGYCFIHFHSSYTQGFWILFSVSHEKTSLSTGFVLYSRCVQTYVTVQSVGNIIYLFHQKAVTNTQITAISWRKQPYL